MADFLNVLYVIWSAGSLVTVIVSFVIWLLISEFARETTKGIVVLVFLLSLVSMCVAIAVNPG